MKDKTIWKLWITLVLVAGMCSLADAQTATPTPTATPTATATATPEPGGCYWRNTLKAKDDGGLPYYTLGPERELLIRRNTDGTLAGFVRYRAVVAATGEPDPAMPAYCHMPLDDSAIREMGSGTLTSLNGWMLAKVQENEGL